MRRSLKTVVTAGIVAGCLALPACRSERGSSSFEWQRSYEAALTQAQASNQAVVAYLYTDWCSYCKRMEAETFSSSEFQGAAAGFTWLKLNAEEDADGIRLRDQYGVKGYPTIVVLDQEGLRLDQIEGFLNTQQLLQRVSQATSATSPLVELRNRAEASPSSAEAQYAIAEKYLEMREYRKASEGFQRVLEADPENRQGKTELAHYHLALSLASLKEHEHAHQALDQLAKEFPKGELVPDALILRGQVYYHEGELRKARAQFDQFLSKYPSNEKARLVRRMVSELAPDLPLRSAH
jgi:TolA-binding protein